LKSGMDRRSGDNIIKVIEGSYGIKKHVDFLKWLRTDVVTQISHEILIAAWGDFKTGSLRYDISSEFPGVTTRAMTGISEEVGLIITDLFKKWAGNGGRWFLINNFSMMSDANSSHPFINGMQQMNSLLVFGLSDERTQSDCLYVFLDSRAEFQANWPALPILMPHLNHALSRLQSLRQPIATSGLASMTIHNDFLTTREHEVLHWVSVGKSNYEISIILNISLNTVKNHLKRIFSKMNVTSRAQAVARYRPQVLN
jgi:transcriptional regulator EpsA